MKILAKSSSSKFLRHFKFIPSILQISLILILTSCNFTQIDPPRNEVVSASVFSNDASAQSAISGIYSLMITTTSITNAGTEQYTGLASDELINYSATDADKEFYANALTPQNTNISSVFWTEAYKYIFNANAVLEGLDKSTQISSAVKKQLQGEALFIRALCHAYLTNLFGSVPLVLTTDYRLNASISRSTPTEVYQQVINDLLIAQAQLPSDYAFTSNERVRPTKWAASALLARLYLYSGNWTAAEEQATLIINNTTLFSLVTDLNSVFLKNSVETIWQLKPVIPSTNTRQASIFILDSAPDGTNRKISLTDGLVNAFEVGDKRRTSWINSVTGGGKTYYYAFKYKKRSEALSEYSTMFRLAEMYLIRAEARAQLSDLTGSLADLNTIRKRAGLANSPATDKSTLLSSIEKERRSELFTEGGHRWFDLKRTARATAILQPLKTNWSESDMLFPIPQAEINVNPALMPQNSGY